VIQRIEERGMRLVVQSLPSGGTVADVGCGYGRWFPITGRNRNLVGMDLAPSLTRAARSLTNEVPMVQADVRHPPFLHNTLSAAYSVKVLQFLPQEHRPSAIASLVAAIAPGGRLILYEKTRGCDGSRPQDWIAWADQAGCRLLAWYGNHYALLDRLLLALSRRVDSGLSATLKSPSPFRERHRAWFRMHERTRQLVLTATIPIEPLLERLAPRAWADHGIFVFEKH
jgi:SAM-dependent methyltransferase